MISHCFKHHSHHVNRGTGRCVLVREKGAKLDSPKKGLSISESLPMELQKKKVKGKKLPLSLEDQLSQVINLFA